jgi:MFS family permease
MAFFNGVWSGPAFGLAMSIAAPRVRGVVASFLQLFVNLIGAGAGPFVAGTLSDLLSGGLRHALALCFTVDLWAAAHYFLAAKAARKVLGSAQMLPRGSPTPSPAN